MVHICGKTVCVASLFCYASAQFRMIPHCIIFHYFPVVSSSLNVRIDPQNYTITEGDPVNITLVTDGMDMVNFNVTLQDMDGSAIGECCHHKS